MSEGVDAAGSGGGGRGGGEDEFAGSGGPVCPSRRTIVEVCAYVCMRVCVCAQLSVWEAFELLPCGMMRWYGV